MTGEPPMASLAVVAVGSNIDPETHIVQGLDLLAKRCPVVAVSTWYRTPAVGPDGEPRDDPHFINGAIALQTDDDPTALRALLREVEQACGRSRGPDPYAPRTLDLDLVVHRGRIVDPDALADDHVAVPVGEVAAQVAPAARWAGSPAAAGTLRAVKDGPLAAWRPKTL